MTAMLDKLIGALRQAGLEFGAEQLADSFWLAPHLPRTPADQLRVAAAELPPIKPPPPEKDSVRDDKMLPTDPVRATVSKPTLDAQLPGAWRDNAAQGAARGLPVHLPGAASLPEALAIARALRPLRKRMTTTRWFHLDEKRTAERLAAVEIWLPVLLPGRERWLNATIIVDAGASMAIWRSTVNEFRCILQSLGAFRKVEVRRMDTDDPETSVPIFMSGQSTVRQNPLDLADPSGRAFFLIISDCVGSAWWDGRVAQLLEPWARTNHVAVLQILPRAMWDRTALGAERAVSLTSPRAMCPNANLSAFATGKFQSNVKLAAKDSVPIPVMELGAASLARWARDAVSATGARFSGRLLRTRSAPAPSASDDLWSQSLGEPFLTVASVPARRLANLMAAAPPFNLPLLRVIREGRLSGEATQIHEAEFLLGGLLTIASNKEQRVDDPDRVIYDFKSPELRAMLRSAVAVSEAIEVMGLEEVGEYLGQHLGRPGGFSAMFRAPDNYVGGLDLAPIEDRDPIARFTADMLRWFGGKYAALLSTKSDIEEQGSTWDDYKSVVWFVQSSSRTVPAIQSSAVAVRLRRERETARTYLLTCAHLARGSDPRASTDPIGVTFLGWRAGTTFTPRNARTLRVVAAGQGQPVEPIPDDERAASVDWALLEIAEEAEALAAPAVTVWAGPNPSGRILACGYLGKELVNQGVVTPTISDRRLKHYASDLGLLILAGNKLGPGMSGAGLFDADGGFLGIHLLWRGKQTGIEYDAELVATSAHYIRQRLKERGFHVATDEVNVELAPVAELVQILRNDEFRRVNWREALNRVLPRLSTHSVHQDPVHNESLADALRELEKSEANAHGVNPLHEFAFVLSRMTPVKALQEWIDKHVPPEIRRTFATVRPDVSVLIAGTGSYNLPPAVYEAAIRVGWWAAGRGLGLVTGGWQGVDHVAAREFADSLDRRNPIELWLTHVVRTGREPDFKPGKIIKVGTDGEEYARAIELASAVILVGGLGGTWNVAENAVRMQVPVFPLPWTGGDAAKFHHQVLANWTEHEWMGMLRGRFEALSNPSEALNIIAEQLQPTRQHPKPQPPAPKPDDIAWMMFVASKPPEGPLIRTDDELRSIQAVFRRMRSDRLAFEFKFDVTWEEFQVALASRKPTVFHFCGHAADDRLVFRDSSGGPKRVDPIAFADAIETFGGSLRVIVLNADDTGAFANSVMDRLLDSVVIAPERVVTDDEAIRFAKDFYGRLADGDSVRRAFMYASQPRTGNSGGGAYSIWSKSVDPAQLTATSGFIDSQKVHIERALLSINKRTRYLWPTLTSMPSDSTAAEAELRGSTFEAIKSDLDLLRSLGHLQYDVKFVYNERDYTDDQEPDDRAVYSIKVIGPSQQVRSLIAKINEESSESG
jgi:Trypsin-like peptidase domain